MFDHYICSIYTNINDTEEIQQMDNKVMGYKTIYPDIVEAFELFVCILLKFTASVPPGDKSAFLLLFLFVSSIS